MADMVSFGVAPALLIYFWQFAEIGQVGWIGAFIYMASGAF
jgi:CDP-diacylglycerol--serine O-phosphatidyltransferase